jgi:CheY-like chemotaxis protein
LYLAYFTKRVSLLIFVEDNEVNQTVMTKMLVKLCCEVDIANNGEIAFNKVTEKLREKQPQYDVVFMDLAMPVCDGLTSM